MAANDRQVVRGHAVSDVFAEAPALHTRMARRFRVVLPSA